MIELFTPEQINHEKRSIIMDCCLGKFTLVLYNPVLFTNIFFLILPGYPNKTGPIYARSFNLVTRIKSKFDTLNDPFKPANLLKSWLEQDLSSRYDEVGKLKLSGKKLVLHNAFKKFLFNEKTLIFTLNSSSTEEMKEFVSSHYANWLPE